MSASSKLPKHLAKRYEKCCSNIWVEFNDLARRFSQVNLGQGQPNYAPSDYIQKALADVVLEGNSYLQYTQERGHLRLRRVIAAIHSQLLERTLNPAEEVLVTHGAYESLQCAFLGLVNPGDEVILIEPFYDSYKPMCEMAGGVPVFVPLRPAVSLPTDSSQWKLDAKELEEKFSDKTKLIVINTPNNPIGKVFTRDELQVIADLCIKYDAICVSDEVYEWLIYPGVEHVRIATLPEMWQRTVTISSASKSFSVTGWRVGWSIGPKELIDCLMVSHQNGDCVCTTPAQEAIARCLEKEAESLGKEWSHFESQRNQLLAKRDMLVNILSKAGFVPCIPQAGYFILANWSSVLSKDYDLDDGTEDPKDFKFAKWLLKHTKISSIPPSAFYGQNKDIAQHYIRFCFFKTDETLSNAEELFKTLH